MNKWAVGAVIGIAVIGGAVLGANYYADARAEKELAAVLSAVAPNSTATHGPVHYSLLRDRLDIDELAATTEGQPWRSIRMRHVTLAGGDPLGLRSPFANRSTHWPIVDTAMASGMVLAFASGDHVAIDEVAAEGVDLAATAKLIGLQVTGVGGSGSNAPVRGLSLSGIKTQASGVTGAVEWVSLSGLDLSQPLPAGGIGTPVAIGQVLTTLSLDKAEIAGADFQLPAGEGRIGLRRFEATGIAPGRVGGLSLEGLTFDAPGRAMLRLDAVALAGLAYRLRSTRARVMTAALGLSNPAWAPGRVFFDRFSLDDFELGTADGKLATLSSIRATMTGSLARASAADFEMNELAVDLTKLPYAQSGFDPADLGLSRVVLNVDARSRYDQATRILDIPRYAFVLPDLGSLTIALKLGDLTIDGDSDDPIVLMQRIFATTLRRFEIRYEDQSLAMRLLRYSAKRANSDVDSFRAGLIDQLVQRQQGMQNPVAAQMVDALVGFLKVPRTITVVIEPPSPLSVASLARLSSMDPNEIPRVLGLTIR